MRIHVADGYVDDDGVEKDLGLLLRSCPEKHQAGLQRMIRKLADQLGREVPDIAYPEKGFLPHPLSQDQRWELNAILTPQYGRRNAEQQQELIRSVAVNECGEPMDNLQSLAQRANIGVVFTNRPIEPACGGWAGMERVLWLRKEVCFDLLRAFSALNKIGITPRVEDCWRHEQVQKGLLLRRVVLLARQYPTWDVNTVKTVAMSLTAPSPGLAGHQAGAAVDWRMMSDENTFLDLGNDYPEGGAVSSLDFPYVTFKQWETRTLFAAVMFLAGFKVLYTEDWHGSRKDRGLGMDRKVVMQTALFGPIREFDNSTGKIVPYKPEDIDVFFLTDADYKLLVEESRKKVRSKGDVFFHSLQGLMGLLTSSRKNKRRERRR